MSGFAQGECRIFEEPGAPEANAADASEGIRDEVDSESADPEHSEPNWRVLVQGVQAGDESALEELYGLFGRGLRYYLCRQTGIQDLDDRVHDALLIVVKAIRNHEVRDPECLTAFVRTVVRRQAFGHIRRAVASRKQELAPDSLPPLRDERRNPEQDAFHRQKVELMRSVLQELSARDQEILKRFYLQEQTQEEICQEMSLTATQFRLLKSRAKARFGELGKSRIQPRSLTRYSSRAVAKSTDEGTLSWTG